tara:strand:- start:63 stop:440 length:378 start_codon:yes stop_codon:yes gene_type:complete
MRYLIILSFILFSCVDDEDELCCEPTLPMTLTISNQYDNISVRTVSLVGYEFEDIEIDFGQARTFTLDDGINGGYDNVNINVRYYCGARHWTKSVSKNFVEGENTTITLVACANGQGGCQDVCFE